WCALGALAPLASRSALFLTGRGAARSPLFPYTTRFRSSQTRMAPGVRLPQVANGIAVTVTGRAGAGAVLPSVAYRADGGGTATADRKSTRLNSSHVKISYAVFCLKKKTNTSVIDCIIAG